MIYIFRKEMKKWHSVLWVVFASLALTSAIFWRKSSPDEMKIASVNNEDISLKKFRQAFNEIKVQIDSYKAYARAYGVPIDMFLKIAGLDNPEKAALDRCIKDGIIDQERSLFNIQLDQDYFAEILIQKFPPQLKDQSGNLNIDVYKFYLSKMSTSAEEYEKEKEEELKRDFFGDFVKKSYYIPVNVAKESFIDQYGKKKFYILKFSLDSFLNEEKQKEIKDLELEQFFQKNKEIYRVPEKRIAKYWTISSQEYEKKIDVSDQVIQNFYEKNKTSLFRIPPKIKIRHILFEIKTDSSTEQVVLILEKAKEIHKKVKANPDQFGNLAKKHSQDKLSASKEGLIDFFERGAFDSEFERAAFRLQEKDELSDVIKTEKGFEIIQLVERISASEKPLDLVKDEIIKTIKAKRAMNTLKADVEKSFRIHSDEDAFFGFIKENNLKEHQTEWLTKKDISGHELENLLAEKLFSNQKKQQDKGFFAQDGKLVLYQLMEKKDSYIPKFSEIKKEIKDNYYTKEAEKKLKEATKKAKLDFFEGEKNLENLCKKFNLKLIETEEIKKGDSVAKLELDEKLINKAFILDDPKQILLYKNKKGHFLVQLAYSEPLDAEIFDLGKEKIFEDKNNKDIGLYLEAFIASLLRNAKIERSEKILNQNTKN